MSRKKNRKAQDTQVATEQHLPTEATQTQGTDLPEIPVAEVADLPVAEPADAPAPEAIPVEAQVPASAPEATEPTDPQASESNEAEAPEATDASVAEPEQPADAPAAETSEPTAEPEEAPAPEPAGKRKATPKKLSALDAAYKVLSKKREPMSCKELIGAMAAKGLWSSPNGKTPHATLYAAILREITTKGENARFLKADRGRFAAKID
jgi:hypothetical protein